MDFLQKKIFEQVKNQNPVDPISYVKTAIKPLAYQKLNESIEKCFDCVVNTDIKSYAYGNSNGSIMLIGDTIDQEQINDKNKIVYPFVDTIGSKILNTVFEECNIDINTIFWMNAVNCCSVDDFNKKKNSSSKEINNCKVFLDYAIEFVEPLIIILLGDIALKSFFPDKKLINTRGQQLDKNNIKVFPTYHPEYLTKLKKTLDFEIYEYHEKDFKEDIYNAILYVKETFPNNNIFLSKNKGEKTNMTQTAFSFLEKFKNKQVSNEQQVVTTTTTAAAADITKTKIQSTVAESNKTNKLAEILAKKKAALENKPKTTEKEINEVENIESVEAEIKIDEADSKIKNEVIETCEETLDEIPVFQEADEEFLVETGESCEEISSTKTDETKPEKKTRKSKKASVEINKNNAQPSKTEYAVSSEEIANKIIPTFEDNNEWEKIISELDQLVSDIVITEDINSATYKVHLSSLSLVFQNAMKYHREYQEKLNFLSNKESGIIQRIKIKYGSGNNSDERKFSANEIIENYPVEDKNLKTVNLSHVILDLENKCNSLKSIIEIVKFKKELLMLMSSMLKIEANSL